MIGVSRGVEDALRRVERGVIVERSIGRKIASISSLVYNPLERISTTKRQVSGTTLCCVPACIIVVVIFTLPKKGDTCSNS